MKCDAIDGSVVNGLRQPIMFSFVLDKPTAHKVFCGPKTILFKNKSLLITITFYLEDDDYKDKFFDGELLIFTIQLVKV